MAQEKTTTFFFNTGVKPESGSKLFGKQIWKNGTKQIPFTCKNVPDNAIFVFACSDNKLPEAKYMIVREILDSGTDGILSKYAYFRLYQKINYGAELKK